MDLSVINERIQSLSKTWICVPTYWTDKGSDHKDKGPSVYDHPTPLDEKGTLARMLKSFKRIKGKFNVLIIATTDTDGIDIEVQKKVHDICQPFSQEFPIFLVSKAVVDKLNEHASDPFIGIRGYGPVRNVQLIVPYALGVEVIIGIDDDEIIEDVDYLEKVERRLSSAKDTNTLGGLSGPYADKDGNFYSDHLAQLEKEQNRFLKKKFFINQAIKTAMTKGQEELPSKTNLAFGGNMCITRRVMEKTCFDPYIKRGEDFDFVMSAKLNGFDFYFCPDIQITHLPPDATDSELEENSARVFADIERFIYLNEKSRYLSQMNPNLSLEESFNDTYPGAFLRDYQKLQQEAAQYLESSGLSEGKGQSIVDSIVQRSKNNAKQYYIYQSIWRERLNSCADNVSFKRTLLQCRIDP